MHRSPLPGTLWRHYKSTGGLHHVYEVIGCFCHSETHEPMVVYRPRYQVEESSWVFGYEGAVRPLSLWYDEISTETGIIQRFIPVDVGTI